MKRLVINYLDENYEHCKYLSHEKSIKDVLKNARRFVVKYKREPLILLLMDDGTIVDDDEYFLTIPDYTDLFVCREEDQTKALSLCFIVNRYLSRLLERKTYRKSKRIKSVGRGWK